MRILFWNVRGLGYSRKKDAVKWFLDCTKADIVILLETKLQHVTSYIVRRIWGGIDLGFQYLPSIGSRGGILILWKRSVCSTSLPLNGNFYCSIRFSFIGTPHCWHLVAVYGPSMDSLKQSFMDELLTLQQSITGPWCLLGDFNLIRFPSEKKGGGAITNHMRRFNQVIAWLELNELPLLGAKYTWISSSNGSVRSRIDRAFVSDDWEECYPSVTLTPLPKPTSDHIPLLISSDSITPGPIPFRFCSWWVKENGSLDLVRDWWATFHVTGNPGYILWQKLKLLKGELRKWRKQVDHARRERSNAILSEIESLDLVGEIFPLSDSEQTRKESLVAEWAQIARIEEKHSRLKSRLLWLRAGDSNSSFFHRIVKGRQKRNRISKISVNNACHDSEHSIRVGITNYFRDFFNDEAPERPFPHSLEFPTLAPDLREFCDADLTKEEVFQAIKSSKADKAPGPDGFSMDFFKLCWDFVHPEVMDFIHEIQNEGYIEWRMNNSFIVLLPKKKDAINIKDYRPISLINCGFKIFTKVLAHRLKISLQQLISPLQNAFLPKRQILDGVLVAAECIDSRLRQNRPGILCKLDIEKAFDSVNWRFLDQVLTKMGFGPRIRKWISITLSSGRFSVLINGRPGNLFPTHRGVRQGDPSSPYLFIIAIEVFSLMLSEAAQAGLLTGFRPNDGPLQITHLLFADDTMVFLDATIEEIRVLKGILFGFEWFSGLKINYSKTSLIPVGNCTETEVFASMLGCKSGSFPISYLGLPLGTSFKSTYIWNQFVERIETRLLSWKRNSLSKGGRLILIKSCLLSIPNYFLSLFPIPSKIALRMEKLIRGFLWGEKASKKPFCLVKWATCAQPRARGGIGIRGFNLMNKALISKWIWRYAKERNSLWRMIINQKHGTERGDVFPRLTRSSHGVGLWKFIPQQAKFVHANSSFVVGNGKSIRFWIDKWCHTRSLKDLAPHLFSIVKRKQSLVSEVVKVVNGLTSIHLQFYTAIDYDAMDEVVVVHNQVFAQRLDLDVEDELVWDDDSDEGFSVSAAYSKLSPPSILPLNFPHQNIWRKGIPLKCQFLAWSACLHRIATFDLMRSRRIIWVNHCTLCMKDQETSDHLFIHCSYARGIWYYFMQCFQYAWVMPFSVEQLFSQWTMASFTGRGKVVWSFLAHAILWSIWAERNCRCFDGVEGSLQQDILIQGTDTSSSTLEWAMAELLRNPDKMEKMQSELREKVVNEHIHESDFEKLPYLQAMWKETLRMHPPIPLLVHRAEAETEICGYTVPKHAKVLVNVWAIGRDPNVWENPNSFTPERFLGSSDVVDFRGRDFELIPFGAGRRICPGLSLAEKVAHLNLAGLLKSFDWKLEGDMNPEDMNMEETTGFAIRKDQPLLAIPKV